MGEVMRGKHRPQTVILPVLLNRSNGGTQAELPGPAHQFPPSVGGALTLTDVTPAPSRVCRKRDPNAAMSNERSASRPSIVQLRWTDATRRGARTIRWQPVRGEG